MEPRIDSITYTSSKQRKKPKLGDTKIIKGVLHRREFKRVHNNRGEPIGFDCTGGRQNYVWVPVQEKGDE